MGVGVGEDMIRFRGKEGCKVKKSGGVYLPWLVACLNAVRATPRYKVAGPSSFRMTYRA